MQFTAIFALALASLAAGSAIPRTSSSCNLFQCALALGPAGIACVGAGVELGVDPVADAACLLAVVTDAIDVPPSCSTCF